MIAVIAFVVVAGPSFRRAPAEVRLSHPLFALPRSAWPVRAPAWSGASHPALTRQAHCPARRKAILAAAALSARDGRWFAPSSRAKSRKASAPPQASRTRSRNPPGAFCRSTTSFSPTNGSQALTGAGRHRSRELGRTQSVSRPASPSSAAKASSVPLAFQASAAIAAPPLRWTRISAPSAIRTISTVPSS
jgi:hypothetical protein